MYSRVQNSSTTNVKNTTFGAIPQCTQTVNSRLNLVMPQLSWLQIRKIHVQNFNASEKKFSEMTGGACGDAPVWATFILSSSIFF